jgi:A/G-specific adenine glycosylase
MVSEVMLQQTQVERVRDHYLRFVGRFPTLSSLAGAPLTEVLEVWQGLGYNRRALNLKRAAMLVMEDFDGVMPRTPQALASLPGIGRYTAGAILAFAFNQPAVFLETNIRSVYLHHFFGDRSGIHDRELLPLVEATMDREEPRGWYNALMDYGAALKRTLPNPSRRSLHHTRQSPFAGSNRQQRSIILKALLASPGMTAESLVASGAGEPHQVIENLRAMEREGLLACEGGRWRVA